MHHDLKIVGEKNKRLLYYSKKKFFCHFYSPICAEGEGDIGVSTIFSGTEDAVISLRCSRNFRSLA